MQFMNDRDVQEMIHVRGFDLPGLNFNAEKRGDASMQRFRLNGLVITEMIRVSNEEEENGLEKRRGET